VEVAFFLVLFLGQYLLRRILYFRYVSDPLTNFVDLLYLSNISMVVLDDKHSGWVGRTGK
jgi:meckelin